MPSETGTPILAAWTNRLSEYLAAHCAACHAPHPSSRRADWAFASNTINLTRPENSYLLTAHLAKAAGGWELSGTRAGKQSPLLFQTVSDPLYIELLEILHASRKNLDDHPREDMPGAKIIPQQRDFGKTY